jgi:hypothetical protein
LSAAINASELGVGDGDGDGVGSGAGSGLGEKIRLNQFNNPRMVLLLLEFDHQLAVEPPQQESIPSNRLQLYVTPSLIVRSSPLHRGDRRIGREDDAQNHDHEIAELHYKTPAMLRDAPSVIAWGSAISA